MIYTVDKVILLELFLALFISKLNADLMRVCQGHSKNIACDAGQKINIELITQTKLYGTRCNKYTLKKSCTDFSNTHNKCQGQQQCDVVGKELETGICTRYPRYFPLQYTCYDSLFGYVYDSYTKLTDICSSTRKISCFLWYGISNIEVTKDSIVRYPLCDGENKDEIENCLACEPNPCTDRNTCNIHKTHETGCYDLPFSVDIWYECLNDSTFNDRARSSESKDKYSNASYVTLSKRTVTNTKNREAINDDTQVKIFLDKENRLLGFDMKSNRTFALCAYLWTNTDASVACKHLNLSKTGIAGTIPNHNIYPQLSSRLICTGNETFLFECERVTNRTIKKACKTAGDATVQCDGYHFTESNETLELTSGQSTIGFVLGIVVGCLLLFTVIILVLRYRKHSKRSSSKQVREQRMMCDTSRGHDNAQVYTDVEEETSHVIADPSNQVSKADGSSYFVLNPKETGYNRTLGVQKDSTNQHGGEDHYASSVEGVYDVTNKNRHINKDDTNVYSHVIDDVYDTSRNNRKQGDGGDYNYQECSVQENINNSSNATS